MGGSRGENRKIGREDRLRMVSACLLPTSLPPLGRGLQTTVSLSYCTSFFLSPVTFLWGTGGLTTPIALCQNQRAERLDNRKRRRYDMKDKDGCGILSFREGS